MRFLQWNSWLSSLDFRPHLPSLSSRFCTRLSTIKWIPLLPRVDERPTRPIQSRFAHAFLRSFSFPHVNGIALCPWVVAASFAPPEWVWALVRFVCFPIASYLMRCKSSVKVAQLAWFIYAFSSPSAPPALWCPEWLLMFHDLHPLCVGTGAHLELSVVIFCCCIDVPRPCPCIFRP